MLKNTLLAILICFATCLSAGDAPGGQSKELAQELKTYRHKILFETNRDGNWEIYSVSADGSNLVNITKTPDLDEVYAKASPDGTMIAFLGDDGKKEVRSRSLYLMKADGSGRMKIADGGREPCWSADSKSIAFLKSEFDSYNLQDFATKGLFIYDTLSKETREHPNKTIHHLYTLNWTPDGKWFVATVHGGMGFKHNILALEANGDKVYDLGLGGCRPDVSPDGKTITWGNGDCAVGWAELDFSGPIPKASKVHNVVETKDPIETYHADWSPDGKYIAFSHGPKSTKKSLKNLLPEFPGVEAPGWNICIADAAQRDRWVMVTTDGKSNKEPDWIYVKE